MLAVLALALAVPVFAQDVAPVPVPAAATPASGQAAGPDAAPATAPGQTDKKLLQGKAAAEKPHVASGPSPVVAGEPVSANTLHRQRKAAKLYLRGVRLLEQKKPEPAWDLLKQAAELMPENPTYVQAAELARQSSVTQLVQESSREQSRGDGQEASKLLEHALEIDPKSDAAKERQTLLADQVASTIPGESPSDLLNPLGTVASGPIVLEVKPDRHTFHLRNNERQVVQDVFKAYGIDASVHESVQSKPVRLDLEDANFTQATHALGLVTQSFYEPLDPHRVIVAKDTRENRTLFQRQELETIYLPGLNEAELKDMGQLAKTVFDAPTSTIEASKGTLTLRAPTQTLSAFNRTVNALVEGRSQIDLDVKVIQLAHISTRETGTTFFQQTGVYNVFSEIATVLNQNQSLVQQIIASGLVPNASTLQNQIEILAILVGSGQVTGTPFNQGFLPFGGGLTQSIVTPGPATLTLSLNSSDTRELDDVHLKLIDQEAGTIKTGERYPIETSSYSALALTAAATLGGSSQTVPQIQYEDLGLTLKATPRILRSQDVALTLDLKIEALGGTSLNGIPVLDSRTVQGVITLRAGETAVMLSDLSRQEASALSGLPGVGDIPGLQDISDISRAQNVARLLILVTPKVVRDATQQVQGPMMRVERSTTSH
jgi:general secretion pathway protein D